MILYIRVDFKSTILSSCSYSVSHLNYYQPLVFKHQCVRVLTIKASGFFMSDKDHEIINETINEDNSNINTPDFDLLLNASTIIYPEKLHFDLSLHVAKNTLSQLPHSGGRIEKVNDGGYIEKVYDDKGELIESKFISGMDDEAAAFYIKTMSSNLRAYFAKVPANYSSQQLAILAKKGLNDAHTKSGLNESEIEIALLSFKNYKYEISPEDIKDRAFEHDISPDEARKQLEQAREEFAIANPATGSLGRKQRKYIETIALHSGLIGYKGEGKCTYYAHNNWKERQSAIVEWMKTHVISNGKIKLPLSEVGKTKEKTLSEMYCLSLGIQQVAQGQGHEWASIVCTLPASKHPNPLSGNNTWDGTTPDAAGKIISHKFSRVRAMLAKKGIFLSGLWTREAHYDATPHVNYLVFFPVGTGEIVKKAFCKHFDHSSHAVVFKKGEVDTLDDGSKPSNFASYAMKYFTKFFSDNPSDDAVDEVAWASVWNLRRYAFIGLPSIEIWRGMRKTISPISDPFFEQLRLACRNGDAAAWISMCGGLNVNRSKRDYKTVLDAATRTVVGVERVVSGVQHIHKNLGEWTIEKANK